MVDEQAIEAALDSQVSLQAGSPLTATDLNIKGITSYTYQRGELSRTVPAFWKTPGDTIVMKVLVTVRAEGKVESTVYMAGDNILFVEMIRGGDRRWGIMQISTTDQFGASTPDPVQAAKPSPLL